MKLLLLLLVLLFVGVSYAAIPQTINVHGILTNSTGEAENGTYSMVFKMWDSYTGGSQLWNETKSVTTDDDGIYSEILHNVDVNFSNQRYLSIKVENDSDMTPRINFTSVPSALYTNYWDALDTPSDINAGDITDDNTYLLTTGDTASGDYNFLGNIWASEKVGHHGNTNTYLQFLTNQVKIYASGKSLLDIFGHVGQDYVKLGDGGDVDINLNDDVFVRGSDGFVGIATISPLSKLHVNGRILTRHKTLTSSSDSYDVSVINMLFLDISRNNIVIGGFEGGVAGQVLHIAVNKIGEIKSVTLEFNEASGTQKIFLSSHADETIQDTYGGWTLVCDGTNWYDTRYS